MDAKSKVPASLVETRPALAEGAPHPTQGTPLPAPPKRYTRGVHDQIVEYIKRGNRPNVAAGMAGIPSSTYYAWMRSGKEGDPHLAEFAEDVEMAMAVAEGQAVETIAGKQGDFNGDPENARYWLERARADGWSKEANAKFNAMIDEFLNRLETNLPPDIYQLVISVASGATPELAAKRAPFQLTVGSREEEAGE